jgi:hypothetical protein
MDLSFYDMPGIFVSARAEEDRYLPNVVENLSVEYMSHPEAIILWAVPMNIDTETSNTFQLIRKLGAQDRTLGVMTKADLLSGDPADHERFLQMMNGDVFKTGAGYFITARKPELDLEQQKFFEEHYFDGGSQAWPEVFDKFRHRTGVEQLVMELSKRLGEEFAKR